jgi:hypothetical protein
VPKFAPPPEEEEEADKDVDGLLLLVGSSIDKADDKSKEEKLSILPRKYWLAKLKTRVVVCTLSRSEDVACMRAPLADRTCPKVCVLLRTWGMLCGGAGC